MRDPMSWALPLFRAFGVLVRLHILYPVVAVGLILRLYLPESSPLTLLDTVLVIAVIPFAVILAHEFGHIFAVRSVGGDGDDILMWPLGGLASVDTPHDWKAHTVTAAGGPLVNVVICFAAAVLLAGGGFLPTVNPIADPFVLHVKNYRDGKWYTGPYELRMYAPVPSATGTPDLVFPPLTPDGKEPKRAVGRPEDTDRLAAAIPVAERALAPTWVTWTNRVFWVSWMLLLFNLLPAYPLDGGQMLQGLVWWRTDYRRGTTVACGSGYVVGVLFVVLSLAVNEAWVLGLALFMLFESWRRLKIMEMEGGEFGYGGDFGYAASAADDDDDPPAKPARPPGALRRWLAARAARRAAREQEAKARDDERMDQLLAKINAQGPASLTAEEQAFMKRVSQRYRKQ